MFAEVTLQGRLARLWQATTIQVQTKMGEKQKKYTLKLKLVECIQDYTSATYTTSVCCKIQQDIETISYFTYFLVIYTAYQNS